MMKILFFFRGTNAKARKTKEKQGETTKADDASSLRHHIEAKFSSLKEGDFKSSS